MIDSSYQFSDLTSEMIDSSYQFSDLAAYQLDQVSGLIYKEAKLHPLLTLPVKLLTALISSVTMMLIS